MVDYYEATLIDPRTLKEAKVEKKIEEQEKPTITINGKVEKTTRVARATSETKRMKTTKTEKITNVSHKNRKTKIVKATIESDFSQELVEEIKWDSKKLAQRQVNTTHRTRNIVVTALLAFLVCLGIVYQYSLVNNSFMEKKKLENNLAEILKQNEQLEVKIEGATNMKTISEEARERLGMQKIDNQQKVYVDLDKSDYIKPSVDN